MKTRPDHVISVRSPSLWIRTASRRKFFLGLPATLRRCLVPVLSGSFRWLDGRLAHVVSSVDITENKKNEEIIARLALYDPLTNLPNRRKLMADADRLIDEACATGGLAEHGLHRFRQLQADQRS